MAELKRLCPECGEPNPMERVRCSACGAHMMSDLPARSEQSLPTSWKRMGASLAVSAATLALRVGLDLATKYLEKQMARAREQSERTEEPTTVQGWRVRRPQPEPPAKARFRFRGRRVRRSWRSDGSGDVEVEEFGWEDDGS